MTNLFPVTVGNILLRSFTLADRSAKSRLDADPEVSKYLGSASHLEDDIRVFQRQGYGLVAIEDKKTTTVVGHAWLQHPEWKENLAWNLSSLLRPRRGEEGSRSRWPRS